MIFVKKAVLVSYESLPETSLKLKNLENVLMYGQKLICTPAITDIWHIATLNYYTTCIAS